jgi:hypothetical protein
VLHGLAHLLLYGHPKYYEETNHTVKAFARLGSYVAQVGSSYRRFGTSSKVTCNLHCVTSQTREGLNYIMLAA